MDGVAAFPGILNAHNKGVPTDQLTIGEPFIAGNH